MSWFDLEGPYENPTDADIEAWEEEAMSAEADDHPTDAEIEGWQMDAQIEGWMETPEEP